MASVGAKGAIVARGTWNVERGGYARYGDAIGGATAVHGPMDGPTSWRSPHEGFGIELKLESPDQRISFVVRRSSSFEAAINGNDETLGAF